METPRTVGAQLAVATPGLSHEGGRGVVREGPLSPLRVGGTTRVVEPWLQIRGSDSKLLIGLE